MNITELTVRARSEQVTCWLTSPDPSKLHERSSILLNISATRQDALLNPQQNHPTKPFLEAGHHVLSFDLPHHGDRIDRGTVESVPPGAANGHLRAMSKALAAGNDPFAQFVADGKAALDACIKHVAGIHGKVVGYGVSRAAYCLLRLAAADRRIAAVAGPSPVTDWAQIGEFADHADPSEIERLHIENWAEQIADRAVYLCIGSQDDIVGTESCVQFAMKLFERQRAALPEGTLRNQLHVVDTPSHSPTEYWRLDATQYLLQACRDAD